MSDHKLNVLIRTSRRPRAFKNLMTMLKKQTYENKRLIVSVDDDFTYDYVKQYICEDDIVKVDKVEVPERKDVRSAPYNTYFNDLIDKVDDGYIFCVDDDDRLANKNTLKNMMGAVISQDDLYIFKIKIGQIILPSKQNWGNKIVIHDVGVPNFVVHSKFAKLVKWDGYYGSDGEFIIEMSKLADSIKWVDQLVYFAKPSGGKPEL
jgi:hypothetical protein